jgi:succinoglycan biosynthesis transport protein ExoP
MLDTITHPQIVHNTNRFDYRVNVRPRPSFGLRSLWSRKRLLGIGVVMCLALATLYLGFRSTTYTASSQLLIYIRQVLTGPDQAILPGRADLPMVQNQIELLRSGNVLAKVIDALRLVEDPEFAGDHRVPPELQKRDPARASLETGEDGAAYRAALVALNTKLVVRQVGTSHMVTVSFKASDPKKAALIVNSVIRFYLQERGRASDAAASKAPALRELYQSLGPSAQVVSEAEPPVKADGPPAMLVLLGAALFGLSVAAAIAILLDVINDTIRSPQQMEYVLGLECLGVVPRTPGVGGEDAIALRLLASGSPVLRRATAMMQDVSSSGPRMIGVTSVVPGEGATTLAIGLAKAVAASGKRVLLIDAVPENPSIARWVASPSRVPPRPEARPEPEALHGLVKLEPGLHVLPLAERLEKGARLMRRGLLDEVLSAAGASYDLVIVDMPALVAGPDVRAAAQTLDGFLLVVKWGDTKSELVRQAFQSAGQARPNFIGTVLNMADESTMGRYGFKRPAEMNVVAKF